MFTLQQEKGLSNYPFADTIVNIFAHLTFFNPSSTFARIHVAVVIYTTRLFFQSGAGL